MKGRSYDPEFKLMIVKALLSKEKTIPQLCREHSISDSLIHTWKKIYREKGEAAFSRTANARPSSSLTPEEQEVLALKNKVAQLERFIGQQAVEISLLKKLQELDFLASKKDVKGSNSTIK